jgi:hypothetical protein
MAAATRRVVYRSEYLGYLPFGQYHWVTVGGKDVSAQWPWHWEDDDLDALAGAGELTRISAWVNPQDRCEVEVQYDLAEPAPRTNPCT